ncbi:uncharacterized protein LOC116847367 [Odontomachus brunneus]|uniref:uncharacterized protein LOC116847367 n=1 Tax=Odontomachus brunneus TaxID=486640 RepID=UPI0013F26E60|nr:uncharacterized protein LOC116847367 [Odontomachus brunneus]
MTATQLNQLEYYQTGCGSGCIFPYYDSYARRRNSFANWPHASHPATSRSLSPAEDELASVVGRGERDDRLRPPDDRLRPPDDIKNIMRTYELAACGFFYSGLGDITVCFKCGLAIGEWPLHDSQLSVTRDHAAWNRTCMMTAAPSLPPYVRRTKLASRGTLSGVGDFGPNIRIKLLDVSRALDREFQAYRMMVKIVGRITDSYQSAVSRWEQAHTAWECLLYSGGDTIQRFTLMESVWRALDLLHHRKRADSSDVVVETTTTATTDASSSYKDENAAHECCICYGARNALLLPCRHFVTCAICASRLDTCPLCRSIIWCVVQARL